MNHGHVIVDPGYGLGVQEMMFAWIQRNFHLRPAELPDEAPEIPGSIHKIFTVDFPCEELNGTLEKENSRMRFANQDRVGRLTEIAIDTGDFVTALVSQYAVDEKSFDDFHPLLLGFLCQYIA